MTPKVLVIGAPTTPAAEILRPLADVVTVADRFEAAARARLRQPFSMIVSEAHTTIECFELRALAKRFPWIPERNVVCLWMRKPRMALVLQQATGCSVVLARNAAAGLLSRLEQIKKSGTGPVAMPPGPPELAQARRLPPHGNDDQRE